MDTLQWKGSNMKRIYFLPIAILSLLCVRTEDASAKKFKKVDSKGIANMIFASRGIKKGKEKRVKLKKKFTSKDKIFARAYFPRKIGRFRRGEKCHVHIWLDGKVVWRGTYSGRSLPNASWDQIQLYIRNTKDDDFKGKMSRALQRASTGKHKVKIVIMRDKFIKYKYVKKGKRVTKRPVYKPVYLSKGTFSYVVN